MIGRYALDLDLNEDHLVSCIACGMCLPHCPTYRVSGEESASPRGRIALMREVHETGTADEQFSSFIDACIGCLGCETACPAGVPYGELLEGTRVALAPLTVSRWRRLGFALLGKKRLLVAASRVLAVAQRVRLVPTGSKGKGLPRVPLRQPKLAETGDDAWLFTGCVMDAWMRETHVAVAGVLAACDVGVTPTPARAGCCGALAMHAGLAGDARKLARRVIAALNDGRPVLVDSAGCGAQLKSYGDLLGTPEAAAFAGRVFDVHEWMAANGVAPRNTADVPAGSTDAPRRRVAISDPCHLRHAQGCHEAVRTVLADVVDVVELDDEGLCCGAGGAYATTHPDTANAVRERKVAAIDRAGAAEVVSANPGCVLHLRAAGVVAAHPLEVVAEELGIGR